MTARIIDPHRPAFPQLVPGVKMWSNGRETVQCPQRPGPEWFPIAVNVKEAA